MMKRIITVLTVAAFMAVMVVAGGGYAFGLANPDNKGNASNGPGQANAEANCTDTFSRQGENDIVAGGGPKAEPILEDGALVPLEPTNCDHFFQDLGRIGKNK